MELIWFKTCDSLAIPKDVASKWFEIIHCKLSSETNRHFHNWNELLLRKKEFLHCVSPAVVLAVFFQYYEFDVKTNCAEKNCEKFREFSAEANFRDEAIIKRVAKLLGDVSVESLTEFEDDANIFQDLDLVILGSSPEEYTKYTELLRKEYSHLDDANYKKMRLKILQTFLMIPTLYLTPEFHSRYEEAARKNINQEIEELKK